jgi:DNA-binding response OmpR family regulator
MQLSWMLKKLSGIREILMAKILIVDDDVLITSLMQSLVSIDQHEPFVVNDSTEAMSVAKSVKPDLITLDLMMPHLNGFDLCALLRADPQFANTPIIIVSAKEDSQSRQMAFSMGATEYMNKPFNIDEFLTMLKRLTA